MLSQLAAQQIEDHPCQDRVEGVYAQLLVGWTTRSMLKLLSVGTWKQSC
jgi:hypothetical protein